MPVWLVIGLLALLLGLQPVTTDLYLPALPALPALKLQLQASMAQSQLTLTALLLSCNAAMYITGTVGGCAPPSRPGRWCRNSGSRPRHE